MPNTCLIQYKILATLGFECGGRLPQILAETQLGRVLILGVCALLPHDSPQNGRREEPVWARPLCTRTGTQKPKVCTT